MKTTQALSPAAPGSQDPLAQLIDIQLPAAIEWWPLAFGWWLLLAILLTAIGTGLYLYRRHQKLNRYRHEALALLSRLPDNDYYAINQLLKRTAITVYGNSQVASLHGQPWANFLCVNAPKVIQNKSVADLLTAGLYAPLPSALDLEFYRYAQTWIKLHRGGPVSGPHKSTPEPSEASPC